MKKVIHCRDVGFDCEGVIHAKNEEEAMQMVAQHARDVHGVHDVTPEIAQKIKSVMRDS